MATVVNGKNFLVYVNGEAIAGSKTCKLTLNHEVRDTFTKDDAWKTIAEGARGFNVSADGLVAFDASNYTLDELTNLVINRTRVHLKFMTGTSGNKWWHGYGYITSVDLDAANEESTAYSCSFDGDGALTQKSHT